MMASPITFTIEDLIGAIVPGMVWSVEFFTINELVGLPSTYVHNPEHATSVVPSTYDVAISYSQVDSAIFYIGFAVCSFILGYISNAYPTKLSENISYFICSSLNKIKIKMIVDGKFPYDSYFSKQKYCSELINSVDNEVGSEYALADGVVFSYCKRLLKSYAPQHIRISVLHLEAQCRMLSSLLLASVANVVLVIYALGINTYNKDELAGLGLWLVLSLLFTIVLAYIFRFRRYQEVDSIYTYTFQMKKKVFGRS